MQGASQWLHALLTLKRPWLGTVESWVQSELMWAPGIGVRDPSPTPAPIYVTEASHSTSVALFLPQKAVTRAKSDNRRESTS